VIIMGDSMFGKVILVVGYDNNCNIGTAVKKKFENEGALVITMDKNCKDADWMEDAADSYGVNNAFTNIKRQYGRLDGIMCCQGVNIMNKLEEYDLTDFHRTIDANLTSLFVLLQNYVKFFDNDGNRKAFVVVTSDTAEIPKTLTFAYGASKAGANQFLRCTARELMKQHADEWIVTGFAAGMVSGTPMDLKTISDITKSRSNVNGEEARKMLVANIPAGRGMTTDEVAEWLFFLTTKGSYASGCILRVDGGQCQG